MPFPTDGEGKPLPPPIPLPPGYEWEPVYNPSDGPESRPVKWKPNKPIRRPGDKGSQPGASWDPKGGHWDCDPGYPGGERIRVDPEGNPVDHDGNPLPVPKPGPEWVTPPPFSSPPGGGYYQIMLPSEVDPAIGIGAMGIGIGVLWQMCRPSPGGGCFGPSMPMAF